MSDVHGLVVEIARSVGRIEERQEAMAVRQADISDRLEVVEALARETNGKVRKHEALLATARHAIEWFGRRWVVLGGVAAVSAALGYLL